MDIARRLSSALYGATEKGTGLETADVNDQETLDKLRDDAKKQARAQIANDLKKFLKKNMVDREIKAQLAVYDKTLGAAIQKKLGLDVVYNPSSSELLRGIRSQVGSLLEGLEPKESDQMALG